MNASIRGGVNLFVNVLIESPFSLQQILAAALIFATQGGGFALMNRHCSDAPLKRFFQIKGFGVQMSPCCIFCIHNFTL